MRNQTISAQEQINLFVASFIELFDKFFAGAMSLLPSVDSLSELRAQYVMTCNDNNCYMTVEKLTVLC